MLVAEDLTVRLGRRLILQGLGFSAAAGTLTAIAGPNGSGKTTLLRALTGDLAYRGRVRLNGREVAGTAPPALAEIRAVVAQTTRVAFRFTVLEVVRLGALAARGRDETARQALAAVGLAGYEARVLQDLSGGEQQRVHLARALAQVREPAGEGGPCWLFLDEPVASLDIAHQLQVMRRARDFADRGGGVVAVMHDLNLTAMFADRVVLMAAGRILAEGTPAAVMTDARLSAAYGCRLRVGATPAQGPFVLPQAAG